MITVIFDNTLSESQSNGEMYLRGTIVEAAVELAGAKGKRCQVWLEANPTAVDLPGKAVDLEATFSGSYQVEGTQTVGLRITDISVIRELPEDEAAEYKLVRAQTSLSSLLANPNQVANKRKAPKVNLAEAAATGEVAAPVAVGADL